uniref:Uncharacterized protein n=1 Tax=Chromera velia CCMP2878 TaxID=1169474 RepID=A0A0G4H1J0_9ALVE|eukprot:Cvel_5548.t1-p1 / transcript=Cvel_5548.t1 / gene=Cvel_5548 / organism=Chromera_velia_CCMP2878 / gene_product=hypothetical protein / transcript_product=hypothetical protein / location=Cvel_scaffold260:45362-45981(-) / protein_length=135 / sequence_SO=supercontig / SO=protein_coding / is_pseudo=false
MTWRYLAECEEIVLGACLHKNENLKGKEIDHLWDVYQEVINENDATLHFSMCVDRDDTQAGWISLQIPRHLRGEIGWIPVNCPPHSNKGDLHAIVLEGQRLSFSHGLASGLVVDSGLLVELGAVLRRVYTHCQKD